MRLRAIACAALLSALAGCAGTPPARQEVSQARIEAMLSRIRAAAARDQSAISVVPLRAPGVTVLQQQARSAVIRGDLEGAAAKLAQALAQTPDSPPLLQARAELDLRRRQWRAAEASALDSWKKGPRVGALCARNWQTVIEVRRLQGDAAGADTAGKWLKRCHVEKVHRY